jgi:DNA ligase (NAD+)
MPGLMELRGEAYIPVETFKKINRERADRGLSPYSNPRNLAAGTLRMKDHDSAVKRGLKVQLFSWGAWLESPQPVTEADFHDQLRKWGFPVIGPTFSVQSFEDLIAVIKQMEGQRENWAFASDGLVIELEQSELRQVIGRGQHWPNWAAAYKFPSSTKETVIQDIIWQTGETGRQTPVAIVQPVNLDGRTISRINLYNQSYMDRLKVEIGTRIVVELRGHVIPAIREVVGDSGK